MSTQLRQRSNPPAMPLSTSPAEPKQPELASLRPRTVAAAGLFALVTLGTLYAAVARTAQSDAFVASMTSATPTLSYFANKHNVFNQLFVKYAWAWTTLAFLAHFALSPPKLRSRRSVARFALATIAFLAFTAWFFGPAMMDRVRILSGGECVLPVPNPAAALSTPLPDLGPVTAGNPATKTTQSSTGPVPESHILIPVPAALCYARAPLSPASHPELFLSLDLGPDLPALALPEGWARAPRIRKGHDVSGHIFLLTLSVLTLVDELAPSWGLMRYARERGVKPTVGHWWATVGASALVGLWTWMMLMTSVFFHTPQEIFSGYFIGLAGYAFSQIPLPFLGDAGPARQ